VNSGSGSALFHGGTISAPHASPTTVPPSGWDFARVASPSTTIAGASTPLSASSFTPSLSKSTPHRTPTFVLLPCLRSRAARRLTLAIHHGEEDEPCGGATSGFVSDGGRAPHSERKICGGQRAAEVPSFFTARRRRFLHHLGYA
jgi:hypothetical protein